MSLLDTVAERIVQHRMESLGLKNDARVNHIENLRVFLVYTIGSIQRPLVVVRSHTFAVYTYR